MKATIRPIQCSVGRPEDLEARDDVDGPEDEPDRDDRDRRADQGAEQA